MEPCAESESYRISAPLIQRHNPSMPADENGALFQSQLYFSEDCRVSPPSWRLPSPYSTTSKTGGLVMNYGGRLVRFKCWMVLLEVLNIKSCFLLIQYLMYSNWDHIFTYFYCQHIRQGFDDAFLIKWRGSIYRAFI